MDGVRGAYFIVDPRRDQLIQVARLIEGGHVTPIVSHVFALEHAKEDGTSVQLKQTDPGGAQRGIMQKMSDACSAADLQKKYSFTVSGSTTPIRLGDAPRVVFARGDAQRSRERQFSRCERLLGTVRIDAPGSRREGRRTVDNDHARISGQWRQGNPGLPDRSGCNGGRTLHVRWKVKPSL